MTSGHKQDFADNPTGGSVHDIYILIYSRIL